MLADRGKDVVIVHGCRRQKPELDLRIRRFKTFSRPTTGSDGDERLVDRPRGALFINVGMSKGGEPRLLIRFKHEIRRDWDHREQDEQNANQVAQRHSADKEQRQQHRHPDDHFTQVRLHQNQKARCTGDGAAHEQTQHRMHLFELTEEQGEHHDSGDDCELGRLKINRTEMEPAASAVNLLTHKLGQDQKEYAGEVHR